jgi:hypothetical protein
LLCRAAKSFAICQHKATLTALCSAAQRKFFEFTQLKLIALDEMCWTKQKVLDPVTLLKTFVKTFPIKKPRNFLKIHENFENRGFFALSKKKNLTTRHRIDSCNSTKKQNSVKKYPRKGGSLD